MGGLLGGYYMKRVLDLVVELEVGFLGVEDIGEHSCHLRRCV